MNPALIKLSGRTYRSRPHHIITYSHFDQYPQYIDPSESCHSSVKSFSSVTQFITVFMIFIYPYF